MKKLIIFSFLMIASLMGYTQTTDSTSATTTTTTTTTETSEIKISNQDTTKISFGGYKIIVIEEDGKNATIKIGESESEESETTEEMEENEDMEENEAETYKYHNDDDNDDDDVDVDCSSNKSEYKTRTNWGGLSYGFHQLLNDGVTNNGDTDFLDLESGYSWAWEFLSLSVPVFSPYVSLTTGLGVRWDRYQLADGYKLSGSNDYTTGIKSEIKYEKNQLRNTSLEIPILLNISTSTRKKANLRISVGYIQTIGLKSKAVYEYVNNGKEYDFKERDNFNLRKFNGAMTARVGYRGLTFYGNYGLDSIFDDKKGPKLNPLTIGLSMRLIPVLRWSKKYSS